MQQEVKYLSFTDFEKVDMKVGQIVEVEDFPRARKPSYKLKVDFGGTIGIKSSSIQAKNGYTMEEVRGMQVVAVVNFQPKNIAGFISEVLVLGVPSDICEMAILTPSKQANIGGRVY